MNAIARLAIDLTERGWVPDTIVRHGVRHLLKDRLDEIAAKNCEAMAATTAQFVSEMDASVLAPLAQKANEQHYEVPAEFFGEVLGKHRKYSACWWPEGVDDLDTAEATALEQTCHRARIQPGQTVLELGCGWGSLTLWMAEHFPSSTITAVSNSASQREYILGQAARRKLHNVEIVTADMNTFDPCRRFDRVVSVEMFEHMRNYRKLFERVHSWLEPSGCFFMHIFCHRTVPYAFEVKDESDWMSRHFFSGGIMPSDDLPLQFQDHLKLAERWRWSGTHYARTARAWLDNMDARREQLWPVLEHTYGADEAQRWWVRWRLFFTACEELFGWDDGQEWWVSHYLFERPDRVLQ